MQLDNAIPFPQIKEIEAKCLITDRKLKDLLEVKLPQISLIPFYKSDLNGMMATPAFEASEKAQELQKKLKPLSIELMSRLAHKVDRDFIVMDPTTTDIDKWEQGGSIYTGLRKRGTEEVHGPIRFIVSGQSIVEATYKANKPHGLYRQIKEDLVMYRFFVHGALKARVRFDAELNEIERIDQEHLLSEFTAESITR